ncbi:MAG: hypothetical protein QOE05_2995 [Actinomycetota bacterium]|jgi:acetyl esterase/lipase|nr:hypothetical protein [Actinomycetota bacterium]
MAGFLDMVATLPSDYEVAPGLTAAEFLGFYGQCTPAPGVTHDPAVVYGTAGAGGRELTMHLCRAAPSAGPSPAIVFIHGGGWAQGDPYLHVRHCLELAARGYVAAAISFRQSGEAPFPAALEDAKCAVRWLRAHAAELEVDAERIAVAGGSSGGHLAAMVATAPDRFEGAGGCAEVSSRVAAAVLWYPPTDLAAVAATGAERPELTAFLGELTPERLHEASPLTYVSAACPPVLTMTGSADELVDAAGVRQFHDALSAAGVANELVVFPGEGHSFDLLPAKWQDCFDRMLSFLDAHLATAVPT